MFSTHSTATARQSRFTAASDAVETSQVLSDGTVITGRAYVGTDRNGNPFLVHTVNGAETAVALHAVATAVASGKVIPPAAVVGAYAETGALPKLAKAVADATK